MDMIKQAMKEAEASLNIEGLFVSSENNRLIEAALRNEISHEQFVQQVVANETKPVQRAMLITFPDVAKEIQRRSEEGYKVISMQYLTDEKSGNEAVRVKLEKHYEQFLLTQVKNQEYTELQWESANHE